MSCFSVIAGSSCEERLSDTKSESIARTRHVPNVALRDAGVLGDAAAGGFSGTGGAPLPDAGRGPAFAGDHGVPTQASAGAGPITAAGAGPITAAGAGAGRSGEAGSYVDAGATAFLDAGNDIPATQQHVARAILVSVDGLGGKYLEERFAKGDLPGFTELRRTGSSTLNARADYDFTITLPNHTSMLTGRPVARDPDLPANVHHGWTINGIVDATYTLHNSGNPALAYVASVFDITHDRGMKTCMYAGKLKFAVYSNSYDATNGAPDTVGVDNGRNKIDRVVLLEGNTEQLISTAEADIAGGSCDFAFIHIADLDTPLGHGLGWGSEAWSEGLARVDAWIARLVKFTSKKDPGTAAALVVTADHGGQGSSHGDSSEIWNYQIPFFAVGPGYVPNTDLYSIASSKRRDPGLVRPRYSVTLQPVRNADAANVLLAMLGLPPVPGSYMRDLLGPQ
ncbi:MAG TPA: alkaline phosphatase family protein [Polyangiaceae bacterium]